MSTTGTALSDQQRIAALETKLDQVTHQLGMVEDAQQIRSLQHIYGFYLDKCLYNEVVDLFARECEMHFFGGIFRNRAGLVRVYCERFRKNFTGGKNGPVWGFLLDHPMLQDIVHVAPDRKTAKARLRCMMMAGRHDLAEGETRQFWEGAIYENVYEKEDGIWKIKVLNYRPVWHAYYQTGWAYTKPHWVTFYTPNDLFPKNPIGPDELEDPPPVLWPETDIIPFHYPHPVTGQWVKGD